MSLHNGSGAQALLSLLGSMTKHNTVMMEQAIVNRPRHADNIMQQALSKIKGQGFQD